MSLSLLSKLTEKTVNYHSIGGTPDITWQDVCCAMSGLDQVHTDYLRFLGTNDFVALIRLSNHFEKITGKSQGFCMAAIREASQPKLCKKCSGANREGLPPCERCMGSGIVEYSQRDRVRMSNCSHTRKYFNSHSTDYGRVLEACGSIAKKSIGHIKAKLGLKNCSR